MPARDAYHAIVREALIKDGWTITHDPFTFAFGLRNLYIDLGAEGPLAAEKGQRRIAVEIKSFGSASEVRDLEVAVGQFMLYREVLLEKEPERKLYLAVSQRTYASIFGEPLGIFTRERFNLTLLVFEPTERKVAQWIE